MSYEDMTQAQLERLTRGWTYDSAMELRDQAGDPVDLAAWRRAWTLAVAAEESTGPITQPEIHAAAEEVSEPVEQLPLDRLADVAYEAFLNETGDYVGNYGYTSAGNRMPLLWRSVVSRVLQAMGPVEAAFVAVGDAIGKERERTNAERARAYQFAVMFEDVLGRYETALLQVHSVQEISELPESVQEELEEYREQFELSACDCEHEEDQPHVDFRRTT